VYALKPEKASERAICLLSLSAARAAVEIFRRFVMKTQGEIEAFRDADQPGRFPGDLHLPDTEF
jgi:hypothetical protein